MEAGLARFPWWKDWRGRPAAIIASGPSTKMAGVEQLKGRLPVIAIKENFDLCPWADVVYGCDAPFWKNRQGLPEFAGLKLAYVGARVQLPGVETIDIDRRADRLLFDQPGVLGSGGNSGFQALNLALQFGASSVALVGFDMNDGGKLHWYGRNRGAGRSNPTEANFKRWRAVFGVSVPQLSALGVAVVNCSPASSIGAFPKMTVSQLIAEWRL